MSGHGAWFQEATRNEAEDAQYREDVREEAAELAKVMRADAAMELAGYIRALRDIGVLDGLPDCHMDAINRKLRRAGIDSPAKYK